MRAGIAASGIRPVPAPEWFGAVGTPPPGASALFIRAHNGTYEYPTEVSVGGSAAELLSLGTDIDGTVPRRVSMWWCADPGPSGEVVSDVGSGDDRYVWEQVLYVAGLVPGEIQHNYNGSNPTVVPHNPTLAPGGVAVSTMHHRTVDPPVPNHDYFDSGGTGTPPNYNVSMKSGVWTAGADLPTDWTAVRYHGQMTVALNPIGA